MIPIARWLERHLSDPLEDIYGRLDEDALEITPHPSATPSRGRRSTGARWSRAA